MAQTCLITLSIACGLYPHITKEASTPLVSFTFTTFTHLCRLFTFLVPCRQTAILSAIFTRRVYIESTTESKEKSISCNFAAKIWIYACKRKDAKKSETNGPDGQSDRRTDCRCPADGGCTKRSRGGTRIPRREA